MFLPLDDPYINLPATFKCNMCCLCICAGRNINFNMCCVCTCAGRNINFNMCCVCICAGRNNNIL